MRRADRGVARPQLWREGNPEYTKTNGPGFSPFLNQWLRVLPPFPQSSSLASGDTNKSKGALARYLLGVPVTSLDRAQANWYDQKYGSK